MGPDTMPDNTDFLLSSYDYVLPPEQIAQEPPTERGASRLMVVQRHGELKPEHRQFADLPDLLPDNALLVANNSRVLPARLQGLRSTGGRVEFLLLTPLPLIAAVAEAGDGGLFIARVEGLLRSGGHLKAGELLEFGSSLKLRLEEQHDFGRWDVTLFWKDDLAHVFETSGTIPLPPYIRRKPGLEDSERYQTIYARDEKTGSVAAPTAGLHFTPKIKEQLEKRGIEWREVTLYVGYGTFSPVRCDDIREHHMHNECIEVPAETAEAVLAAKKEGRPVIAVGTTSARALEGAYAALGSVAPFKGETGIFLYPGKSVHVIDGLITNFHLPCSTLIMLVACLMGRERILQAYHEAVAEGYRFFSYGDAMYIRP